MQNLAHSDLAVYFTMLQLHSKAHPSTSTAANSNEASWTEPDELRGELDKLAERSANGSSSKEYTGGEGRPCKGTVDEVESSLSVGVARFRTPIALTDHTSLHRSATHGVLLVFLVIVLGFRFALLSLPLPLVGLQHAVGRSFVPWISPVGEFGASAASHAVVQYLSCAGCCSFKRLRE